MTKEVMHTKAAAIEQLSFSASAGQTALAHLCGPLDENLRQMETILGVKIVRRGEQFRVSGEKHAAHRALRALEVPEPNSRRMISSGTLWAETTNIVQRRPMLMR